MVQKTRLLRCSALIGAFLLVAGSLILPAMAESYPLKSRSPRGMYGSSNRWVVSSSYPSDGQFGSIVSLAQSAGFVLYGYEDIVVSNYEDSASIRYVWNVPADASCVYFEYRIHNTGGTITPDRDTVYGMSGVTYGTSLGSVSGQFVIGTSSISWQATAYSDVSSLGYTDLNYGMYYIAEIDNVYYPIFAPITADSDSQALALLADIEQAISIQTDYLQNPDSSIQSDVDRLDSEANSIDQMFGDYVDQMSTPPIPDVSVVTSNAEISAAGGLFGSLGGWITSLPGVATICGVAVSCWVLALILYGVKGG